MSEIAKITVSRKQERENAGGPEMRAVLAAEHTADALEGIRQDLAVIAHMLPNLLKK